MTAPKRPKQEGKRPLRLYNAMTKEYLPHRCYTHLQNAHIGAMIQTRWAKVGHVIEVVNVHEGKSLGQYRRAVDSIQFRRM